MQTLIEHPLLALFAIIASGYLLGSVKIKEISLGTSGVLFTALLFGHLGASIPKEFSQLGVLFFVYGIGIGAGPRFIRAFKERGLCYALVALLTIVLGVLVTFLVATFFGLKAPLSVGLFAGALTSTPGLAAALQVIDDGRVSVAYGVAYPFGVIGVVLFVQLFPKLMGMNLVQVAKSLEGENKQPPVQNAWFTVANPSLDGKKLDDVNLIHRLEAVVTRVIKQSGIVPALDDVVLQHGDTLRAVGREEDLKLLEELVGPRSDSFEEPESSIATKTIVVSEEGVAGKTLLELQFRTSYGVTVTRLWRDDFLTVPGGAMTLELGDTIRIVGNESSLEQVTKLVGRDEQRLNETPFLPLATSLLLGVAVGLVPISIAPSLTFRLGMAGGPLFVALLVGHIGRLGPLRFRVPVAARLFIKELGLVLFLAGAGCKAGSSLVAVLKANGISLLISGILITTLPLLGGFILAFKLFKIDLPSSLGLMCGAMTSTPGLGATTDAAKSDVPALAYATVYPVALISVTIAAQLLAMFLN